MTSVQARSATHAPATRIDGRLARSGGLVELLALPAWLFGVVARLRSTLYDRGWLRIERVEIPVVSVGNLTVGGTGKTPMVQWLVRALEGRGLSIGILSRGYGRASSDELNDEGRLLLETCPDVPHVQDRDRVSGASRLVDLGVDVILLDDGFQHRRLDRDLDLVLVDATRPWGLAPASAGQEPVRALLPRGLMREPAGALQRADLIVVSRADGVEPTVLQALRRKLSEFAPGVPIAQARHAPTRLRRLAQRAQDDEPRAVDGFDGTEVDLVSAIGNPQAFEASVRGAGARVLEHRVFPDHHVFREADLSGLGSRPIVVTAKDAVKLRGFEAPLWVLDVELVVVEGRDALERLLDGLPESPGRLARQALHAGLHG